MREDSVMIKKIIFFVCIFILSAHPAFANNLNISNATWTDQDTSANTLQIQFDIAWDNSWYDGTNKDAVWVFVKYSVDGGDTWGHATMKTAGLNPGGTSQGQGTGIDILVSTDKKGAFIQRSSTATGGVTATDVQLVWDYAADGVSDADADSAGTVFRVFGIEMVYIPEGAFYAGDDSSGGNGQFEYGGVSSSTAGQVSSEAAMSFANSGSTWYYNSDAGSDDESNGTSFSLPAAFPKGYAGFYMMKYEITEGQYVDFLNTLTRAQQNKRVAADVTADAPASSHIYVLSDTASVTNRNYVACPASGNGTTDQIWFSTARPTRACTYLSWMDLAAYADWAGLRPMTELEYEKAARGTSSVLNAEYAWGSTSLTACSTISGTENGTETCSTSSANAIYNNTTFSGGDAGTGAARTGILATASTSTRAATGGSYYGVMELSGNVSERAVTVGNTSGRNFAGTHGDGTLTTTSSYEGNATNLDWPGIDGTTARGVTGAAGSGRRGGNWSSTTAARLQVSDRANAGTTDTTRGSGYGGRLVRTASA